MTLHELVKFEVALQDLAKLHGFELVEQGVGAYGPNGINRTPSGSAIWNIYDKDGTPTTNFAVQFRPKQ